MKAIGLVVVSGGVAYTFDSEDVDIRIADIDDIKAGDPGDKVILPAGVGFEQLVKKAGIEEFVEFVS